MTLAITGIYAAILGIMFVVLRINVTIERAKTGISIMHQDNMVLAEKMRRFGNFIETVPFALVLLAIVETTGASTAILHSVGALLLASRLLHPFGLNAENGKNPLRIVSGLMTTLSFAIASGYILWTGFGG
ncbi:MAG: MAPEG family protein [Rhizobiaceae bacterium]|nr:MAPEG family protein [Rhizobiaceae bacterium]